MKEVIITEKQLEDLVNNLKENHQGGSYMAKQQLFTIALTAYKMWEEMDEGEQLEDWMETKIAQSEQSITSVVKAFMYDEINDDDKLNLGDLIIGK
jgi:ribosomal protein L10